MEANTIKHKDMLKQMNSGEPFTCRYVKADGSITIFSHAKKLLRGLPRAASEAPADHTKRRTASQYDYLIPIQVGSGQMREIYTDQIIQFNTHEVIL